MSKKSKNEGSDVLSTSIEEKNHKNNGEITDEYNNKKVDEDKMQGLRTVKVLEALNMTEEQRLVMKYFYGEQFVFRGSSTEYEALMRYPEILEGLELETCGFVKKIISSTSEEYEVLLWLTNPIVKAGVWYDEYDREENPNRCVVIRGKWGDKRAIEEDYVEVLGVASGVETIDIDGVSCTVPIIDVERVVVNGFYDDINAYSFEEVKTVAETIFGKDVLVMDMYSEEEIYSHAGLGWTDEEGNFHGPYEYREMEEKVRCQLEDQNNLYFKSFILSKHGFLIKPEDSNEQVEQIVEFTPDFEHFLVLVKDNQEGYMKIKYFDKQHNQIWEREFEGITNLSGDIYDYTDSKLYIVINNTYYCIDLETGEDLIEGKYVGAKNKIRKFEDGILMLDYTSKSDAAMFTDVEGNILWTISISEESSYMRVQKNGDSLLITYNSHIMKIDTKSGEIIQDCEI